MYSRCLLTNGLCYKRLQCGIWHSLKYCKGYEIMSFNGDKGMGSEATIMPWVPVMHADWRAEFDGLHLVDTKHYYSAMPLRPLHFLPESTNAIHWKELVENFWGMLRVENYGRWIRSFADRFQILTCSQCSNVCIYSKRNPSKYFDIFQVAMFLNRPKYVVNLGLFGLVIWYLHHNLVSSYCNKSQWILAFGKDEYLTC